MTSEGRRQEIREMLRTIVAEYQLTGVQTGMRQFRGKVLRAMAKVPRDHFVPSEIKRLAFANRALPIGEGQTISQPFIVALMTELVAPPPDARVLEIGTGSGYQAAVLSQLAAKVFSVEVLPHLAQAARERLRGLGFSNVEVCCDNGFYGWSDHSPFDGILITAAAQRIPPPLLEQLKPGGRLIVPLGAPEFVQELLLVEKDANGTIHSRSILDVVFVPFREPH